MIHRALKRTYHVWAVRQMPMIAIDSADGRLAERLSFLAAGPEANVVLTEKGVVVGTGMGH